LDAGLLRSPQSAAVESHRRLRWISILCAGQARRSSRWIAQSLRSEVSPEAERVPTGKPSRRAGPVSPGYRVATGGLAPTASGANSVASALGASPGATPARLCEHTMRVAPQPSKPELSTWLGVGTFYLAPTRARPSAPVIRGSATVAPSNVKKCPLLLHNVALFCYWRNQSRQREIVNC